MNEKSDRHAISQLARRRSECIPGYIYDINWGEVGEYLNEKSDRSAIIQIAARRSECIPGYIDDIYGGEVGEYVNEERVRYPVKMAPRLTNAFFRLFFF